MTLILFKEILKTNLEITHQISIKRTALTLSASWFKNSGIDAAADICTDAHLGEWGPISYPPMQINWTLNNSFELQLIVNIIDFIQCWSSAGMHHRYAKKWHWSYYIHRRHLTQSVSYRYSDIADILSYLMKPEYVLMMMLFLNWVFFRQLQWLYVLSAAWS